MAIFLFWPLTLTILTLTFGQVHSVIYVVKRMVTKYLCTNFDDFSFSCFRETWQCCCFDLWLWPFLPWPSVKVIVLCVLWSTLSPRAIIQNLVTVVSVVSKKHGNVAALTFDPDLFYIDLRSRSQCYYFVKRTVIYVKFGDYIFNSFRVVLTIDPDLSDLNLGWRSS